ncbi:MAG: CPBP family intramembrane metalloprotease [Candidatus Riflebacteria bacterium]|nr:CPBP family intramembrane metalloprotease [Candidatus Riflebacteria bacterium]
MRMRLVFTVCFKEIRETLRDRRTMLMMVGLPMLLYPLMLMGMGSLRESTEVAAEARRSVVAVWGAVPDDLVAHLGRRNFTLRPGEGVEPAVTASLAAGQYQPIVKDERAARSQRRTDARKGEREDETGPDHPLVVAARPVLLSQKVDGVLVLWPRFADRLERGELASTAVLYDSVRPDSVRAADRLRDALAEYREEARGRREKARGLAPGFSRAIDVGSENVADRKRRTGFGLGQLLPFLLITLTFSTSFYAAIDLTAGEKERGTMQTLLCAPLSPAEIMGGKFLCVWAISLVSGLAHLTSIPATSARLTADSSTLTLSPVTYLISFALLVPATMMVSALFLGVAAFARDFKDGQNLLTPVLMLCILPTVVTFVPDIQLGPRTVFVPIVNISLLVKAIFVGDASPDQVFLVLVACLLFAALSVRFAARVFERQVVLLGGKDTLRGWFGLERGALPEATPSLALLVFSVTLVAAFYLSLALKEQTAVVRLLVIEYGLLLTPVLVAVLLLRLPVAATLSIRLPSRTGLLAGLLVGPTLLLGLWFGYLAWRTGSVIPSAMAHGLNNGIAVMIVVRPGMANTLGLDGPQMVSPGLLAAGVVGLGLAFWLLEKTPRREAPPG